MMRPTMLVLALLLAAATVCADDPNGEFHRAGRDFKAGGKATGHAFEHGAKGVGQGAKRVGKGLGHGFRDLWRGVTRGKFKEGGQAFGRDVKGAVKGE
jgi:hypothetical protein